jgi:hypothetical protein
VEPDQVRPLQNFLTARWSAGLRHGTFRWSSDFSLLSRQAEA